METRQDVFEELLIRFQGIWEAYRHEVSPELFSADVDKEIKEWRERYSRAW